MLKRTEPPMPEEKLYEKTTVEWFLIEFTFYIYLFILLPDFGRKSSFARKIFLKYQKQQRSETQSAEGWRQHFNL